VPVREDRSRQVVEALPALLAMVALAPWVPVVVATLDDLVGVQ
jgi:hypothetical protein